MGERTREGNDLLREMSSSGVIRYGDAFRKSMEEGHWDLSEVDYDEVARSQATLVFGQMNEPPGARLSVALSGLTVGLGEGGEFNLLGLDCGVDNLRPAVKQPFVGRIGMSDRPLEG